MRDYLDFEKPLKDLEEKLEKLTGTGGKAGSQEEIRKLRAKLAHTEQELFANLTPWQRTQVARHGQRPSALEYINATCQEFVELHGDRLYGDDRAIIGGFARFEGHSVMVIGHQKGKTLKERMQRNFGMPNPEGYRKALRLMTLAAKFKRPIITLIDTPGAYPGIGAEERGQSEAIARNLMVMSRLPVPIISVVIGEGGSGGALALGVADKILMLEHSVYSVISPEGCAAILWDNPAKTPDAALSLKMTAKDLTDLDVVDDIIPEPVGGAHRDPAAMAARLGKALAATLHEFESIPYDSLPDSREKKFRAIGAVTGLPAHVGA
ncbi:MAG: acetyl-CoA carboxylase carboxyltransferase subunit alpha [Nitrospiraceae bacterium]